jgi:tRNA (cytidine32/uridine32-2'-O)-methyltransferase
MGRSCASMRPRHPCGHAHQVDIEVERTTKTLDQGDGMHQHLFQMLEDVYFIGTSNPEIIMRRLKGLFNRTHLTKREVSILRGIYSAVQGRNSVGNQVF